MISTRVAADVGGTFTDVCVLDESSGDHPGREGASTPDPIEGVLAGVEEAGIDLSEVVCSRTATTVATNALITRRFPPAAHGHDAGFPRRHRDPPRHEATTCGTPTRTSRRPTSAGATGFEVSERVDYRRRGRRAARRGRRARGGRHPRAARGRDRRRLLHQRLCQPEPTSARMRRSSRGAPRRRRHRRRARCCRRSSSTSGSQRRLPTPSSRRSSCG